MLRTLTKLRVPLNQKFLKQQVLNKHKCFLLKNSIHTSFNCYESIKLKFILNNDKVVEAEAHEGNTLLDVIVDNEIEVDGFGACGGTASCSTCHLIFNEENFDVIGEAFGDEADMLDLAANLSEYSRLGCQVNVTSKMDGFEIIVPAIRTDAREN